MWVLLLHITMNLQWVPSREWTHLVGPHKPVTFHQPPNQFLRLLVRLLHSLPWASASLRRLKFSRTTAHIYYPRQVLGLEYELVWHPQRKEKEWKKEVGTNKPLTIWLLFDTISEILIENNTVKDQKGKKLTMMFVHFL